MGTRITVKDVRAAVAALEPLLHRAGLLDETARLVLSEGSQTYGRAWRLHYMPEGKSGHYSLPISDYLGWTAAEALSTVCSVRNAIGWCVDGPKVGAP